MRWKYDIKPGLIGGGSKKSYKFLVVSFKLDFRIACGGDCFDRRIKRGCVGCVSICTL